MSHHSDNPCLGCSTNQHCCSKLSGLQLSAGEFRRHFAGHAAQLEVTLTGKTAVVSVKEGGPCPHWTPGGCRIYASRPIDCRVFPYVITQVIERGGTVKITYHTRSDCPKKGLLYRLMPEAEIRALLLRLGQDAFGAQREIVVRHEDEIADRLRNRIKAALLERWNKLRR